MRKFLPYILILVILAGTFVPLANVQAQAAKGCFDKSFFYVPSIKNETDCTNKDFSWITSAEAAAALASSMQTNPLQKHCYDTRGVCTGATTEAECKTPAGNGNTWRTAGEQVSAQATARQSASSRTDLEKKLTSCNPFSSGFSFVMGCIQWFVYVFFVTIPSVLLAVVAKFFDFMAALTLSSNMYSAGFVEQIWRIVRDFANIFFILVLLYAAFQLILGLAGSSNAKKVIADVIIIALLVNFSLFFTKVVIDSSNILALIFYNKIDTTGSTPEPVSTPGQLAVQEKDMAKALVSAFNINAFFNTKMLEDVDKGSAHLGVQHALNPYVLIALMVIYGLIVSILIYAFFIAGFAFFSRMITLIILLVVSPFAFVSYAIPGLKKIDTIGFDSWLHKLMETSFVAAVFMFIIYMTSIIIKAPIFSTALNTTYTGMVQTIIVIFMPAVLIAILLTKGASYAKKASGEFAGKIIGMGTAVAGLAVGGAMGGAALLGTGGLGNLAARTLSSKTLQDKAKEEKGIGGRLARMTLRSADYGTKASFDLRKAPGMGAVTKMTGLNLESAKGIGLGLKEGGYEKRREDKVKKKQQRAKQLEVREDEGLKQNLNKVEKDLQDLLVANSHDIELVDKKITTARQNLNDANARFGAGSTQALDAGTVLADLKGQRKARKDGALFFDSSGALHDFSTNRVGGVATGASINDLEDNIIPDARHDVEAETKSRQRAYADRATRFGRNVTVWGKTFYIGNRANREAAYKIRMGAKLDSGEKSK